MVQCSGTDKATNILEKVFQKVEKGKSFSQLCSLTVTSHVCKPSSYKFHV